jgi:two-component system sensor histidine kinase/response regulator
VIAEVVTTLRPLAEAKGVLLEVTVPTQDLVVWIDRRALSQILINLVNNAIKFTDHREVRITLSQRRATDHTFTEISVADTAAGIRPEDQAKLLQAFTQVGDAATRRQEGTGLGLHLSQKLAALLGGQITAQSEYGKGTTFTLVMANQ